LSIDLPTYFEIIRRKTAVLVGAAGGLGVRVAGGDDAIAQAMQAYGEHLGVAFQIRDDILDLEEETATIGKTAGRDLAKGKMTLPAILVLEEGAPALRRELTTAIQAKDETSVRRIVREAGAIDRAVGLATEEVTRAKTVIKAHVTGELGTFFVELADSVLTRTR
jgi:octaprenyl-diphosphate synthase